MSANGYPLALAVICAAVGVFCFLHRRNFTHSWGARVVSLCAALTAAFCIAGIPPWRDALAGVFGTGPGMVFLVLLVLIGFGSFLIDLFKHHHAVRTSALGIIGATALVLAWAMAPELGHQGSKLGPKTAAAMGQAMNQIRTGHAARAETGSARSVIIFLAVVCLIVVITVMHKHHKRHPFGGSRDFGAAAIGSGTPKAITAGKAAPAPADAGKADSGKAVAASGGSPGFFGRLTGAGKGTK